MARAPRRRQSTWKPDLGPEPLREVLSRLIVARGWTRRQGRLHLERAWEEIVGPKLAEHTRVGTIRRGVFEVLVDHAVLMQELSFQKRRLLEQLRARLPGTTVNDLRFRAGAWRRADSDEPE